MRKLLLALAIMAAPLPVAAVVVLDSTWAEHGGKPGAWSRGFDAHFDLAAQPQFAGIVGFWDGEQYGGSGTWIGNDADGHAYVLTAAHNFDDGGSFDSWYYYSRNDAEFEGMDLWIHPKYDENDDATGGWDMAIVKLNGPITDAGQAPMLYGGDGELGKTATITGFGSRGTGSAGEADRFYDEQTAAAARNIIDEVDGENGPNLLVVDFDNEAGGTNVIEGDAYPVDALEGVLGSGDSGGSTWIKVRSGWAIAGVNVWGDEDAVYGSLSAMARVSTQKDWILSIFPKAKFTP
jgi:hypothetical protein